MGNLGLTDHDNASVSTRVMDKVDEDTFMIRLCADTTFQSGEERCFNLSQAGNLNDGRNIYSHFDTEFLTHFSYSLLDLS